MGLVFAIGVIILMGLFIMAGSMYAVVDYFLNNIQCFLIGSVVFLIIRTVIALVKSYEKWSAVLYFVFEFIRIPLVYITLIWFANDWAGALQDGIIIFILRTGVEAAFVLVFAIVALGVPWAVMIDVDGMEWLMPLIGVVSILIPLVIRMIIEYANNGVWLPVEMFRNFLAL